MPRPGLTRALLLALALAGCRTVQPVPPVVVRGCELEVPPPALPRLQWSDDACLSDADALALAVWHRQVRAWSAAAWERCRRPEDRKRLLP